MSLAERQLGGCFNQCLGQGILAQTCGTFDYKCICSSTFINGFETCISTICTSGDIPSAQQSFQLLCSETGNALATPLPSVLASRSSTQGHNSATLGLPGTLPTTGTSAGDGFSGSSTNNLKVNTGIPLGRIIGAAVGGGSIFLIIILIILVRIRRRRRAQFAISTVNMIQAPSHNFQPQSPPVTAFQPPPPAPPQNPPYMPLSNPSPAWTSQDTTYDTQVNTTGYGHGLVYPGTYPSPTPQGYGNNHPNPSYPPQSHYVPPGAQTPVRLEYPGPAINTQSLNTDGHNYYSAPERYPQPPQSNTSYFSSDVKTPLTSTSEQQLLRSTPGVSQSGTSSPPFTASPPSTQSPSIRPELGDGATGFHITNSHEMDGSDDMSGTRSAQRESFQPGSDGPSGGFRIVNPDRAQPRAGDVKGSDAPPMYSEKNRDPRP